MSKLYKAYLFRSKDPAIDSLRTLVEDSYGGKVNNKSLLDMEKNGGPSMRCMHEWFYGETKRPNNSSLEAAGRSLGMMRVWVKQKK